MTSIQNLDSSTQRATEPAEQIVDFADSQATPAQSDQLPQGVVDLLLQLMPQMPRLSLKPSQGAVSGARAPAPDAVPDAVSEDVPASHHRARLAMEGTLATPGTLAAFASDAADSSWSAPSLSPSEREDTSVSRLEAGELRPPERARANVSVASTPPAAPSFPSAHSDATLSPLTPGSGDGAYLKFPFNRDGMRGVVTVNRQADEPLAPLQLSTRQPDIAAHLARQLDATPQSQWVMADAPDSNVRDESHERQTPQDSRQETDDEAPRQPPEEDERA